MWASSPCTVTILIQPVQGLLESPFLTVRLSPSSDALGTAAVNGNVNGCSLR